MRHSSFTKSHPLFCAIISQNPSNLNVGKKEVDVTEIRYIHSIWKGNHILIEFPPMVANARVRLQSIFLLQKPLITNTLAEYPNFDTMRLRMHPLLLRVCAFAVLGGST